MIRYLSSLIKGSTINDDYHSIQFKAKHVSFLSGTLDYQQTLKLVWCLSRQIRRHITETKTCFFTLNPANIIEINDIYVYIDDLLDIDKQDSIEITRPYLRNSEIVSPEVESSSTFPYSVHYKTIYYSLGKLVRIVSRDFDADLLAQSLHIDPLQRKILF